MTVEALTRVLTKVAAGQTVTVELVNGNNVILNGPQKVDVGGLVAVQIGKTIRYFEAQDVAAVVTGRAPETRRG